MTVVGYAPGVYDMFHVGHLNILRRARLGCDYLIAGVVTDEVVEQIKGRRPVVPLFERLEIVQAVRGSTRRSPTRASRSSRCGSD